MCEAGQQYLSEKVTYCVFAGYGHKIHVLYIFSDFQVLERPNFLILTPHRLHHNLHVIIISP